MVCDVDHVERIYDTHGHAAGDAVLRAIAVAAEASIRCTDVAARFGGEELVVVMRRIDLVGALEVAERVVAVA